MTNKKLERIKLKIIEKCTKCNGEGCFDCKSKCNRLTKYASSGIPSFFWDKSIKKFEGNPIFKQKIQSYAQDINEWYDSGKSLILVGGLGTGKSYMSCCCLKLASVADYSTIYTTMMDIINNVVSNKEPEFLKKILSCDFLVIDEFDSRWIFPSEKSEQMFSSNMEYLLRSRFQEGLPTIICSNTSEIDQVLKDYHSKAFSSLKTKYAEVVYIAGGDLRRKK